MGIWKPSPTPRSVRAYALIAALALPWVTFADAPRDADPATESDAALLARLKQYRAEMEALKAQTDAQLETLHRHQEELAQLRSQLAQMGVAVAPATPPAAVLPAPSVAAKAAVAAPPPALPVAPPPSPASAPKHAAPPAVPTAQEEMPDWQLGLLAAAGLALLSPLARAGMRNKRNQPPARAQTSPPPTRTNAKVAPAPVTPVTPVKPAPAAPAAAVPAPAAPAQAALAAPAAIAAAKPAATKDEWYDEDSLLEEAQLYVNHGRMAQAVEILEEINRRNPMNAEAWVLLLSSYSSLGRAAAFETSAHAFQERHKDSLLWGGIQALGRTLNPTAPLYVARNSSGITVRRPIGDILLELGSLSPEALQICLDEFDSKKDGRLGGYLVKRKIISLAQLDEALLVQQGGNGAAPDTSPSVGDLEKFMADFDPKKHGSMIEYLTARHALSPGQINNLLQQQANQQPSS
jgi:tetratricopeptide (TPR) repeat protein